MPAALCEIGRRRRDEWRPVDLEPVGAYGHNGSAASRTTGAPFSPTLRRHATRSTRLRRRGTVRCRLRTRCGRTTVRAAIRLTVSEPGTGKRGAAEGSRRIRRPRRMARRSDAGAQPRAAYRVGHAVRPEEHMMAIRSLMWLDGTFDVHGAVGGGGRLSSGSITYGRVSVLHAAKRRTRF